MTVSFSEIEQLARTLRTELGNTGVHKISLDAVISGCKDIATGIDKEKALKRREKIASVLEVVEKLASEGEYDEKARDLIRLYNTTLLEYIEKN